MKETLYFNFLIEQYVKAITGKEPFEFRIKDIFDKHDEITITLCAIKAFGEDKNRVGIRVIKTTHKELKEFFSDLVNDYIIGTFESFEYECSKNKKSIY